MHSEETYKRVNTARDAHTFAVANLADAREKHTAAEKVLEVAEEPADVANARAALDLAAARVRAAERSERATGEAKTEAERAHWRAELEGLRAGLDASRAIEGLRVLAEREAKMRREHAASLAASAEAQEKIIGAHNVAHARATALAAELNEAPPETPALPSTARAVAAVLVRFDEQAKASGSCRDDAAELAALAPLFGVEVKRDPRHDHFGGALHPEFPAAAQVAALLDGSFVSRRDQLNVEHTVVAAKNAKSAVVDEARRAVKICLANRDISGATRTAIGYYERGAIDDYKALLQEVTAEVEGESRGRGVMSKIGDAVKRQINAFGGDSGEPIEAA